jgi:hypothetical protein
MRKAELAALAAETWLTITVCHFPTGDQQVEQDRTQAVLLYHDELAGASMTSHEVVVNTIAATRTRAGLRVEADLDARDYPL